MTLLSGLSAFPITPTDDRGSLNAAGLRHLVRRLVVAELDSIGLLEVETVLNALPKEIAQ